MSERTNAVAIIGAGIAGLSTAFNLEQSAEARGRPLTVTLFEAAPEPGGNLRTLHEDGYTLEEGPNGFLDNAPATLRLVERLGMNHRLQRSEDSTKHRFLLVNNRLCEMPMSPPAFIRSEMLSLKAKLRVAGEWFIPPRTDLGRAAEDPATDETVFDFGARRLGRAFAETCLDPMVKGVFGGDARKLSLAAAFPRMVELERDYGGLFKALKSIAKQRKISGQGPTGPGPGGVLHSFYEGIAALPKRLCEKIRGDIHINRPVDGVQREDDGWWIHSEGERFGPFDVVIDASPAHAACRHLEDPALRDAIGRIGYAPIAVICLAFDKSRVAHDLKGFGMLIPTMERRRLLGVLWSSSIFISRAPEDKVVLRCMAGGASDPGVMALDDGQLEALCLKELSGLYGLRGKPERSWIIRWEQAIAQFAPGHLALMKGVDDALKNHPGLFLTGSAYRGISVNHCVTEAEQVSEQVMDYLFKERLHQEA